MMIPVRCYTCGKVIGSSYNGFLNRVRMGENPEAVLDSLGIERYCCRRMIVSHADLSEDIIPLG